MENTKVQKKLFELISKGNLEEIKSFLKNNPKSVNYKNENGVSAVLFCYYTQKPDIGEYLNKKWCRHRDF